jgi:hypothetical protein
LRGDRTFWAFRSTKLCSGVSIVWLNPLPLPQSPSQRHLQFFSHNLQGKPHGVTTTASLLLLRITQTGSQQGSIRQGRQINVFRLQSCVLPLNSSRLLIFCRRFGGKHISSARTALPIVCSNRKPLCLCYGAGFMYSICSNPFLLTRHDSSQFAYLYRS